MKICINEVLYAFSIALDAVEGELLGATTHHGQRVAYISALMGKHYGLSDIECARLSVAAVMHDNALSEFFDEELIRGEVPDNVNVEKALGKHCAAGEHNMKHLPFYDSIKDAVLYHHERADGSGPFGKVAKETPLYARIIHIADRVDVRLDFSDVTEEKFAMLAEKVGKNTGTVYDEEMAKLLLESVTYESLQKISGGKVTEELFNLVPRIERDYTSEDLIEFATMFAKIIDYKSPFTTNHSMGIAQKALEMGKYYGWDEETCNKLFVAGALHDLGKLLVDNDILEKPGKLTPEEYKEIQNHALGTYVILNSISGFSDITSWASLHHEKLNGNGYPFGYTADRLGDKERLMGCLDIYQALVEPRPYKDGMSHEETMKIMRNMVEGNNIDGRITEDIDKYFGKH